MGFFHPLAAAVAIAAAAHAPAPPTTWSPAAVALPGDEELYDMAFGLHPDGSGLLAFDGYTSTGGDGYSCDGIAPPTGRVVGRRADGSLGPVVKLAGDVVDGPLPLPDGTYAELLFVPDGKSPECETFGSHALAILGADGMPVRVTPLAGSARSWSAGGALAADRAGRVVATWPIVDGLGFSLHAAVAEPGAAPRDLGEIGRGPQEEVPVGLTVALAPSGRGLLAWTDGRRVRTRSVSTAGALGATKALGPSRSTLTSVTAGIAPTGGRAVVAWGTQDGGEEADAPYRVYATTRERGSTPFRAAQLLDPGGPLERADGPPSVRVTRSGALLVWSHPEADRTSSVRYAHAPGASAFGKPRVLAAHGQAVSVGFADPDGATAVWWDRDRLHGASAAGGRFGRAGTVRGVTRVGAFAVARPEGGTPVLAWASYPKGAKAARLNVAIETG